MPLQLSEDLLICTACGTQFDVPASQPLKSCRICDDPRQYVPPAGQTWTSLQSLLTSTTPPYKNIFVPFPNDPRITTISTAPKLAIGQRCFLLCTPAGNVLWDCLTLLDQETYDFIRSKGGLKAIVISHPHYYATHVDWARTFGCEVWVSREDVGWVCRGWGEEGWRRLIEGREEEVVEGVRAIKTGGHFEGSLVLLWQGSLFVADSLVTTPSALYHVDRPTGTNSYVFMWSIPNMIPLPPEEIDKMWQILKKYEFESTHGAFAGLDVWDKNVKQRVLESMKIQVRAMGWKDVAILNETV